MEAPHREEIESFVGKNANYYIGKWGEKQEGGPFNWASFFMTAPWALYRKMYQLGFGFLIFGFILSYIPIPRGVNLIIQFAVACIFGAYGNQWYYSHFQNISAELRSRNLTEVEYLKELKHRGGTTYGIPLAIFGGIVLVAIVIATIKVLGRRGI